MYVQQTAYGVEPSAPPQATDMQTHVMRIQGVSVRLASVYDDLLGLIGRLYGEGQATGQDKAAPRPAGLSSEMTEAISGAEALSDRIDAAVKRLSQFA